MIAMWLRGLYQLLLFVGSRMPTSLELFLMSVSNSDNLNTVAIIALFNMSSF